MFNDVVKIANFNSHAHVERDTWSMADIWGICYFNSHAHVERDRTLLTPANIRDPISTHTLTWSVTPRVSGHIRYTEFQLTRSRGAWPRTRGSMGQQCRFQLTRSRGAWQTDQQYNQTYKHFNSHAHVERDYIHIFSGVVIQYFNSHAHVERDWIFWQWDVYP